MRRITRHTEDHSVLIEIDGDLDLITAHDLRHTFTGALRSTADGVITFDLSQVTSVDDDGIAALRWCCDVAAAERRPLMWVRCSQPLRRDLRQALSGRRPVGRAG